MIKVLISMFALAFTAFTVTTSFAQTKKDEYNSRLKSYTLAKMAGYPVDILGYTSGKPFHVFDTSKLDTQLYGLEDQKTINQKRLAIHLMAGLI
jgi:hypothetical protein